MAVSKNVIRPTDAIRYISVAAGARSLMSGYSSVSSAYGGGASHLSGAGHLFGAVGSTIAMSSGTMTHQTAMSILKYSSLSSFRLF